MMIKSKPRYNYQRRVNQFSMGRDRVGLFVYYGGGKTYLSLQWLESLRTQGKDVFPVMVLCDRSLSPQWEDEIRKHSDYSCIQVKGDYEKRIRCLNADRDIYIMGYDGPRGTRVTIKVLPNGKRFWKWKPGKILRDLIDMKVHTLIADESTTLKNERTNRFRAIYMFGKEVPYRAILSGQPITEESMDIWAQMYFLDDGKTFGKAFWGFRSKYFAPGPAWQPYNWVLKQGAAKTIANKLSQSCIRITEKEVSEELPPEEYVTVPFEFDDKMRAMYKQLKSEFAVTLPSGHEFETQWAVVKGTKLHQLCQGIMYLNSPQSGEERLVEILHTMKLDWLQFNIPLVLTRGPVLIWTHLTYIARQIHGLLEGLGIPCGLFAGSDDKACQHDKEAFNEGKFDALILGLQKGHKGLNLQRANQAIFYSVGFRAEEFENALRRNRRSGSEIHERILYTYLAVQNSVDTVVMKAHKDKQNVAQAIMKHIRSE